MKKIIATFILFALVATVAAQAKGKHFSWERVLKSRYPALFRCSLPQQLDTRKLEKVRAGYTKKIKSVSISISDGCSVTVFANVKKQRVILAVNGGISDQIHFLVGPFNLDGSDL